MIYPPRPVSKIPHSQLAKFEASGKWLAQRKFNGHRTLIHVRPDREPEFWNRRGALLRNPYSKRFGTQLKELNLDADKEYWLDGETFFGKVKDTDINDKLVLFDVLQAGHYLFGSPTQVGRLELLNNICKNPTVQAKNNIALIVTDNIWMAEAFFSDFVTKFKDAFYTEGVIEGLVLRKKDSALDNFGKTEYETSSQIRCRKPEVGKYFL